MEIRWRGGWSLVLGWKIRDPSLLLTKPHRDTWIRVKDERACGPKMGSKGASSCSADHGWALMGPNFF